jgi:Holliday junction resolvasome RuvABC endonuclease subunit
MKVIGLDPGGSFGWCVLTEDMRYVDGGTEKHKLRARDPKAKRWRDMSDWLRKLLEEHEPQLVAIESVRRHAGVLAAHAYGFYRYTAEAHCFDLGIPIHALEVGQWKKLSAKKGSASKMTVEEAVSERFPDVEIKSNDHSDAIGIAMAAASILTHPIDTKVPPGGKKKKCKQS